MLQKKATIFAEHCFTDVSDFGGVSIKPKELFVLPRSSCGISAVYNLYL